MSELKVDTLYLAIRSAILEYDAETYHGRLVNIDELIRTAMSRIHDTYNLTEKPLQGDEVPNRNLFQDEKTKTKVIKALHGKADLDFEQVISALERLEEAGILFAEEPEKTERGPRKKNADGTDAEEPDAPEGTKLDTAAPVLDSPPVQA